jgi:TonB family protein
MNAKAVALLLGIAAHSSQLNAQGLQRFPPEAAGARVGQVVTICGMAMDLGCAAPDPAAPLTLLTPDAFPTVGLVIPQETRARFGLGAEHGYVPRPLCVTGKIERSGRFYRVSVSHGDQLQFDGEPQPAPKAAAEALYRSCDEGVVWPEVLRSVHAHYTPDAMRAGIEGSILLQGVVGTDGLTRNVLVLRSLDQGTLDEAAVKAFEQWLFRPGSRLGKPVPVVVTTQMAFTLKR